jgi:beta-lactam-binding protein with PASTA domain
MGANDAIYLLEEKGLKVESKGFGRVYRQSPTPGSPVVKGDIISLDLGFDDLQITKKDSLAQNDSIQANAGAVVAPEQKTIAPPVVKKISAKQNTATKPKPSPEAIRKWKEKVAAQKALEAKNANKKTTVKPKASPEAIAKWKAKVAAQKAAEKKKATTKKTTGQTKKQ